MRMAATAACSAKNRLINHGGVSPLQAVTGRSSLVPSSLMNQLCSGRTRFVVNQELGREEALQRAERIRIGALESFHWIDSHETLRRALASKSRPPKLEMIQEGATVYIYDPSANRRGLARRMQDQISWSGPGVVVCVERDRNVPRKVWVRIRGKVKAIAIEQLRLATTEEIVGAGYVKEALEDVQKELASGRMIADGDAHPEQLPQGSGEDADSENEPEKEEKETEQMKSAQRLLTDVPLQIVK